MRGILAPVVTLTVTISFQAIRASVASATAASLAASLEQGKQPGERRTAVSPVDHGGRPRTKHAGDNSHLRRG